MCTVHLFTFEIESFFQTLRVGDGVLATMWKPDKASSSWTVLCSHLPAELIYKSPALSSETIIVTGVIKTTSNTALHSSMAIHERFDRFHNIKILLILVKSQLYQKSRPFFRPSSHTKCRRHTFRINVETKQSEYISTELTWSRNISVKNHD